MSIHNWYINNNIIANPQHNSSYCYEAVRISNSNIVAIVYTKLDCECLGCKLAASINIGTNGTLLLIKTGATEV